MSMREGKFPSTFTGFSTVVPRGGARRLLPDLLDSSLRHHTPLYSAQSRKPSGIPAISRALKKTVTGFACPHTPGLFGGAGEGESN